MTQDTEHIVIGTQPEGPCEWLVVYKIGDLVVVRYAGDRVLLDVRCTHAEVLDFLALLGFHIVGDAQGELLSVRICRALSALDVHQRLPSRDKCGGLRIAVDGYSPSANMKTCLRCGCTSGYGVQQDRKRCPALRGTRWRPRPTTDGSWDR